MRVLVVCLILYFVKAGCAVATERCDEETIRRYAATPVGQIAAPDIYFNTREDAAPIMGANEMSALRKQHGADRKNQKPYSFSILQIAVSSDYTMAYDDGTAHVEYDETATGRHVSFDISYLRVWKLVDGNCKVAASYSRPTLKLTTQ